MTDTPRRDPDAPAAQAAAADARSDTTAVPESLVREVAQLVDPLALASLISPDSAGVTLDTHHGLLGVLPYRPGRSPNQRAWDGRIDWAALILYPRTASPVRFPVTEERLARDAANATAYLFPARLFTIRAWHLGGTFQHINHRPPSHPGVFWINLEDAPARGLLAPHQVAFST